MAKPAFRPNQNNGRYNKIQAPYNTTNNNHQQSKNGYPPGGALQQDEGEISRATTGTTGIKLSCGDKNVKHFLAGNLKNYFTV